MESTFKIFLSEHALWVPATWSQFQTGPTKTWTHPGTGKQSRNDYIAISDFLQCTECTTWVVEEVDISTVREDHSPVGILFTFTASSPSPPWGGLRVQFDREQMVAKLQSPRGSSILEEVGSTLTNPLDNWCPWTLWQADQPCYGASVSTFPQDGEETNQNHIWHQQLGNWFVKNNRSDWISSFTTSEPTCASWNPASWNGPAVLDVQLYVNCANIEKLQQHCYTDSDSWAEMLPKQWERMMQPSLNTWRLQPNTLTSLETAEPYGVTWSEYYPNTAFDVKFNLYNCNTFRINGYRISVNWKQVSVPPLKQLLTNVFHMLRCEDLSPMWSSMTFQPWRRWSTSWGPLPTTKPLELMAYLVKHLKVGAPHLAPLFHDILLKNRDDDSRAGPKQRWTSRANS